MSKVFSLVLLACLLFSSSVTASFACIGTPPISSLLSKGSSCGGIIPCDTGLYCDNTATCNTSPGIGGACYLDSQCPTGSSCIGKPGSQKCTANGNPGDTCDSNGVTAAKCGSSLSCFTGTCSNGAVGDGCSADVDCSTGSCHNGICSAPCGTSFCSTTQYCDSSLTCTNLPTSGTCTANPGCAPGYLCIPTDWTGTKNTCIQAYSVANGDWCESHNTACVSGLCWRGHCQANTPAVCGKASTSNPLPLDSDVSCPYGSVCNCDGTYLLDGYGTCKADNCYDPLIKFTSCVSTKCPASRLNDIDYSKSCVNKNCQTLYTTYTNCDHPGVLAELLFGF